MRTAAIAGMLDARKSAGGWQAKCPAHEDKHASLSISEGGEGKTLLCCHAGCRFEDIAQSAGIDPAELFPPKDEEPQKPRIVAEYDYADEQGELLYQVLRMEPKSFRQRRPVENAWEWRVPASVRRVLYRTPELSKGPQGSLVFVVEGEKDADAITAKTGEIGTTSAGGADRWQGEFADQLKGKRVVVIPDNDGPGQKHAVAIVESLERRGVTHAILSLDGLPDKGDVSDWFRAGGTGPELVELGEKALSAGSEFAPSSERMESAMDRRKRLASKVIPFNISYLDDLCLGIHPTDLIIITAATGAGKTTLGTLLAENAAKDGRRVHFFALEAHQDEIEQRMLYRQLCSEARSEGIDTTDMTFNGWMYGKWDQLAPLERKAAEYLAGRLSTLKTFYRRDSFGAKDITRTFRSVAKESDLIILDHLHYVDTDGGNENEDLKEVIKAIRNAALEMEVPVVVIAHLRKRDVKTRALLPDIGEIHGSSNVTKVATKVITVASLQGILPSAKPGQAHTAMYVAKDRYAGTGPYAAVMRYDLAGLEYAQGYALTRINANATSMQQLTSLQIPKWAKRGVGCAGPGKLKNIENGKLVDS